MGYKNAIVVTSSSSPAKPRFRFSGTASKKSKEGEFRVLSVQQAAVGDRVEIITFKDGLVGKGLVTDMPLSTMQSLTGRVVYLKYQERYEANVPVMDIEMIQEVLCPTNPLSTPMAHWLTADALPRFNTLRRLVESLHACYAELVLGIFADDQILAAFLQMPASLRHHHNHAGGLLKHTVDVALDAEQACLNRSEVNRSLVITAALLHDVGKTLEYSMDDGGCFGRTRNGELEMHKLQGAKLVWLAQSRCNSPDHMVSEIVHCITACRGPEHMGLAWPKMPECVLVQTADGRSAGTEVLESHTRFSFDFSKMGGKFNPDRPQSSQGQSANDTMGGPSS